MPRFWGLFVLILLAWWSFFVTSSLSLLLKFVITGNHQHFHSKSDLIIPIMPAPTYPQSTPSPIFLTEQRHKSPPTCPHHPGSGHIHIICHHPICYFTSRPGAAPKATSQPRTQGLGFGTPAQLRATQEDSPRCEDNEATQNQARVT